MGKLLKEPLLHFLILGALIFAAYGWITRDQQSVDQIVVTLEQQEYLVNLFTRTWQRPPTPQETRGLLDDYIREEIAWREGVAMGLEQGDMIVRRRMRQKLELLADEIVSFAQPEDAALRRYLDNHPDAFRMEPRLALRQIYINQDQRGTDAEAYAAGVLAQLNNQPQADWKSMGDPLPLPAQFDDASLGDLGRQFGSQFAESLLNLEQGDWTGPVPSGYGLHLVKIDNFTPARDPELDEVRERVKTAWLEQRRRNGTDELYQRLAEKYSIKIEQETGE